MSELKVDDEVFIYDFHMVSDSGPEYGQSKYWLMYKIKKIVTEISAYTAGEDECLNKVVTYYCENRMCIKQFPGSHIVEKIDKLDTRVDTGPPGYNTIDVPVAKTLQVARDITSIIFNQKRKALDRSLNHALSTIEIYEDDDEQETT